MSWPTVKLGDILQLKYGKSLKASDRQSGSVDVMGSNGRVGSHDQAFTIGETLVIGRKGSIGAVAFSADPCWPIDTTYYIDRTATAQDSRWLYWQLKQLRLESMNKSAAVPGLNRDDVYRIEIPLPPLPEQRRIASILDQADALRSHRKLAMSDLEDASDAHFVAAFGNVLDSGTGWKVGKVRDLVAGFTSGKSIVGSDVADPDGFRVLKISSVTRGRFDPSESKPLPAGYHPPPSHLVRSGDLLISRANTTELVGATALVGGDTSRLTLPDKLWKFLWRPTEGDPSVFVWKAFSRPEFRRALSEIASGSGGSMKNISQAAVLSLPIILPPKSNRERYACQYLEAEGLRKLHRAHLSKLDELFASLQHRAFRGEL